MLYKRGVARRSLEFSFVALLPLNSHRWSVLWIQEKVSSSLSSGFFMASKLVADSTKTVTFILFILAGPPPFYTAIQIPIDIDKQCMLV